MDGSLLIAAFIAVVAIVVVFQRRQLAQLQAGILGGSVMPGCVVVEAIVLFAIAVLMVLAARAGWV